MYMNIKIYYAFCNPHLHNKLKHNVQNWKKKTYLHGYNAKEPFRQFTPLEIFPASWKTRKIQCSLGLNNLARLVTEFYISQEQYTTVICIVMKQM